MGLPFSLDGLWKLLGERNRLLWISDRLCWSQDAAVKKKEDTIRGNGPLFISFFLQAIQLSVHGPQTHTVATSDLFLLQIYRIFSHISAYIECTT